MGKYKMKLGLPTFNFSPANVVGSFLDAVYEIKFAKKRDTSLSCIVKLVRDTRVIEKYSGLLTPDLRFLRCDQLERFQIKPTLFEEEGKRTVYLSENSHGKIDYSRLKNIAESQMYHAFIAWRYMRNWVTTEVQTTGSIDWTDFDNDISPDFSADTWVAMQSTAIKLLKDMPNIKFLLSVLAAFIFGALLMLIGCVFVFLLFLLIAYNV